MDKALYVTKNECVVMSKSNRVKYISIARDKKGLPESAFEMTRLLK